MTRRLTSSGTRSSKQRLPGLHVEDRDAHALGDDTRRGRCWCRRGRAGGRARAPSAPASTPARICPTWSAKPVALDPKVAIGRPHAELLEEDVAERSGRSSGRCGRASGRSGGRAARSRGDSRMISGRVPRTVRTFIARAAAERPGACRGARAARARRRADHVVRRAVLATLIRLALDLPRAGARAACGWIARYSPAVVGPRRLLLGHQDLVDLLARPDARELDLDLPVADQRLGDVDDARGRHARDVGLAPLRRRAAPRRSCRRPRRG